jgi:hypothetical protein
MDTHLPLGYTRAFFFYHIFVFYPISHISVLLFMTERDESRNDVRHSLVRMASLACASDDGIFLCHDLTAHTHTPEHQGLHYDTRSATVPQLPCHSTLPLFVYSIMFRALRLLLHTLGAWRGYGLHVSAFFIFSSIILYPLFCDLPDYQPHTRSRLNVDWQRR